MYFPFRLGPKTVAESRHDKNAASEKLRHRNFKAQGQMDAFR
jgi:hypothetical protein